MPPAKLKKNIAPLRLSKAIREAFAVHGENPVLFHGIASDVLLSHLDLPKEKLEKARMIEANNQRLTIALMDTHNGKPIRAATTVKIFETIIEQLPNFFEKTGLKSNLSPAELLEAAKTGLRTVEKAPADAKTLIEPVWITLAAALQREAMRETLGDEKHRVFTRAFKGYSSTMAKTAHLRKPGAQK